MQLAMIQMEMKLVMSDVCLSVTEPDATLVLKQHALKRLSMSVVSVLAIKYCQTQLFVYGPDKTDMSRPLYNHSSQHISKPCPDRLSLWRKNKK